MAEKPTITKEQIPRALERDIARTRSEMSRTIDEIEERFSKTHWKAVMQETLRDKKKAARESGRKIMNRARATASQIGTSVRSGWSRATDSSLAAMKRNREATLIIAFELGVLSVIGWQSLQRRALSRRGEAPGKTAGHEPVVSLEEAAQKVKEAVLPGEKTRKAA